VTRVGTRGYNQRQSKQNAAALKVVSAYNQAKEFSHFGSGLASATRADVTKGEYLKQLFTQAPGETYSLLTQQLMLDVVLESDPMAQIDIGVLKRQAKTAASEIKVENEYDPAKQRIKEQLFSQKAIIK
jgi:F0F1-type ATP synthase alpha subunit